LKLRHFIAFVAGQQMRCFPRDDAHNGAFSRPDGQVLPQQDLNIPAADRLDIEEAILVDVLHHQADLIAVAGEHDARLAARVQDRKDVAVAVRAHFIRIGTGPGADHLLHGTFEAGRAGGLEKIFEKS
jgi:hypothetical protein